MKWKEYSLDELIHIKHGYAFKGEFFSEEPTADILLTPGNFAIGGGFKAQKLKYYNGDFPVDYILDENDVIVTMTDLSKEADTLGFSAKVPAWFGKRFLHNQRIGLVKLKTDDFDQEYLYWLMRTFSYQRFVANGATGATVKHTSPTKICQYKFTAPVDKNTQRKIASILSAYDDLIENNLKRIKLLEEKASLMYKLIQKELSNAEKIKLYDFADIQMGFAFKAEAFNEEGEGIPIIRIRDIPSQMTKSYTTQEVDNQYWVEKGDLLIGMDGEFHMNEWLGQRGYLVQRVCRLRAKNELYQSYLWQALKEPIHYYETTISGATVAHLGKKHLEEIFIANPKDSMKNELEEMNTMRKLKIVLAEQNAKLREARDILLPKLMNGQIEV